MPFTSPGQARWFKPESQSEWHRCTDSNPQSLCGDFVLRSNVDSVRDFAADPTCRACLDLGEGRPDPRAAVGAAVEQPKGRRRKA